jgi:hypothetical protein
MPARMSTMGTELSNNMREEWNRATVSFERLVIL